MVTGGTSEKDRKDREESEGKERDRKRQERSEWIEEVETENRRPTGLFRSVVIGPGGTR
jgi:hypothetical protein